MRMHLFIFACMLSILCLVFGCGSPHAVDVPSRHHVIIRQSGGEIMDVWVLPESNPRFNVYHWRWYFTDSDGNTVSLSTDVKVMEVWDRNDLDKYHEYHIEFEMEPYWYLYNLNKEPG